MRKKPDISLRKQAKQDRSNETIRFIVEAAIYILKHHGPKGFTAQKVAERAGVNIASFYQYFPNKEALLFHLTKSKWESDLDRLLPILRQSGTKHAQRLKDFIREFFLIEAAEADLRNALRVASVDLKETKEFKALIAKGVEITNEFIQDALGTRKNKTLDFNVDFIVVLVTSFAERTTDRPITIEDLNRQAEMMADMLTAYFKIR